MRRLQRINRTVIDLRPVVDLLTTSPTDPTQLDPLKRELASVQRLSDDVSVRVTTTNTTTCYYTVFQKNPCDYVFDDNLNSKRPIVIIFGTVIT